MTILFFARRFYPLIGGVETHVMEISKQMITDGHRVIVVTENHGNTSYEKIAGIEIYRMPVSTNEKRKKWEIWRWLFGHRTLINQADIIHCHDVFFWYLPFRFLYPRKPVYTTFHGYESYPIRKKATFIRKISEILSSGNICIGDFIPKWYGTHPTIVSYGGVTIPKKIEKKTKTDAVFIGRLDEQTGILTYIEAVAKLQKIYPKFSFITVGDGKYATQAKKVGTTVPFTPNPFPYLAASSYAFISRYLGMLEALAMKKLVFAVYDNSVKEDYLRMSPFARYIIIVNSSSQLIEKIRYFLIHPTEEKNLIREGYQWASKQTWEKVTKEYYKVWKDLDNNLL